MIPDGFSSFSTWWGESPESFEALLHLLVPAQFGELSEQGQPDPAHPKELQRQSGSSLDLNSLIALRGCLEEVSQTSTQAHPCQGDDLPEHRLNCTEP